MRKTFALLITLVLAASCVEQEVLAPVEPTTPGSGVLIVPGLSIGTSMGGEATTGYSSTAAMMGRSGATRAATYPYVIANAAGKNSVIVTKDADGKMAGVRFHPPWFQTPQHLDGSKDDAVSTRFEVAQENGGVFEIGDNTACPGSWRRPTVREWYVITLVKNSLEVSPFDQPYYLTATETQLGVKGWCDRYANWNVFNTELINKANVRCVRDVYENFPDVAGSKVATMWGYTATTGLKADNLVPPTAIKNTATGFELENARYYPADGTKLLYFYAYAPYNGGTINNVDNATVTYDILGQTDVLWAKDDRGLAKNTDPTQQEQPFFLFQHKLMQLKFKVVADASFETNQTVTNITVKSVSTSVKMSIKDGATTFSGSGNISINPTTGNTITTDGTTLAEAMMIAPGSTVTLSVTAGGITFPDITLTGLSAQAGMSHLITLTFKRNAIVPTASMVDWTTGGSADIEVI